MFHVLPVRSSFHFQFQQQRPPLFPKALPIFHQNDILNSSNFEHDMPGEAPKRKRSRPVKYDDENPVVQNSLISSTAKVVADQPAKVETACSNLEKKNPGSPAENGGSSYDLPHSQAVPASLEAQRESIRPESNAVLKSRPVNDESESRNVKKSKEEPQSPKKEPTGIRLDDKREEITLTKP